MQAPTVAGQLKTPLGRTVLVLLAIAFLALLATNVTTFLMIRRTADLNDQIERTHEIRDVVGQLQAAALDAEAGQRGFLLTGRVAYLSTHDKAVAATGPLLDQLERLATGDAQTRRVAELRSLFRERHAAIREAIDLYREGRAGAAVAFLGEADARGLTIRIRRVLKDLEEVERAGLDTRTDLAAAEVNRTVVVTLAGGALILLAAAISLLLFSRYIAFLQAARRSLDEANRGLEETVLERTEELVRANDEIGVARDRAEALLREVNHRVGNSLQLVSSMISLQAKSLRDTRASQALADAQARIEAVAQVHRRLYTSGQVDVVALDDYLSGLIDELRQTFAAEGAGADIDLTAEPVFVPTDKAVALGVITAELVTNAVKYAYGPEASGPIRVELRALGEDSAVLSVEDDGQGMVDAAPRGTGVGGRILQSMAASLNSRVEYDPAHRGVRARLAFDRA